MTDPLQQSLQLELPEPLSVISLISYSPRQAYYVVEVIHIGMGYVIRKSSGAKGAKPTIEVWYRPSYALAVKKQQILVRGKLCKTKGRLYQIQAHYRKPSQEQQ